MVDGDTFWIGGEKVRIADIDTPETHPPRCAAKPRSASARRCGCRQLLNAGPVTLAAADRDTDRYGRLLRIVERDGRSLGANWSTKGWRGLDRAAAAVVRRAADQRTASPCR